MDCYSINKKNRPVINLGTRVVNVLSQLLVKCYVVLLLSVVFSEIKKKQLISELMFI